MTIFGKTAGRAVAKSAILALGFCSFTGLFAPAFAQSPVVIELYTSQGCSSCPPADALLDRLAEREDVIALGLHVDYWDYIGWADVFADPAYSNRQREYARAAGKSMVYTPQVVVGGVSHVVGNKPADVEAAIKKQAARPTPVTLKVVKTAGQFEIEAQSTAKLDMVVQLVRYTPQQSVQINRGENAGRRISYSNIVTEWKKLKTWNGARPAKIRVQAGRDHYAIIVQRIGHGPILAAALLK